MSRDGRSTLDRAKIPLLNIDNFEKVEDEEENDLLSTQRHAILSAGRNERTRRLEVMKEAIRDQCTVSTFEVQWSHLPTHDRDFIHVYEFKNY